MSRSRSVASRPAAHAPPPGRVEPASGRPRLVILSAEAAGRLWLAKVLEAGGFACLHAPFELDEALQVCLWQEPEAIVARLPRRDDAALGILAELDARLAGVDFCPIIALPATHSPGAMARALAAGAWDGLVPPVSGSALLARIRALARARGRFRELRAHATRLEAELRRREREIEAASAETVERLTRATAVHDDQTGAHARRVAELSAAIATELGLPLWYVRLLERAAVLHDLGKIGIPDAILHKPGPLSAPEMATMRTHGELGAEIVSGTASDQLRLAERIMLTHHERWDGSGYLGLRGAEIPLEGRIVAVADVFDAMTHARPYQRARSVAQAAALLKREAGSKFDPGVVAALLRVLARGAGEAPATERAG